MLGAGAVTFLVGALNLSLAFENENLLTFLYAEFDKSMPVVFIASYYPGPGSLELFLSMCLSVGSRAPME